MSKLFYKQDCVGDGLASCPSVSTKKSNFLMSGLLRMWQKKSETCLTANLTFASPFRV